MYANKYRGEVVLTVNEEPVVLRMNFHAISYLEAKFGDLSLLQLIEKFSKQSYKSCDIISILESAYFGANKKYINFKDVEINGGVKAAAMAAVFLLKLGFEGVESDT